MNNNLIAEKEAHSKQCPMIRNFYINANGTELSRASIVNVNELPAYCAGAHCMMWTWAAGSTTHGYCGLRGKVVIP